MNQLYQLAQAGIRHRERILNLATLRRLDPPAECKRAAPSATPADEQPANEAPAEILTKPLRKKRA